MKMQITSLVRLLSCGILFSTAAASANAQTVFSASISGSPNWDATTPSPWSPAGTPGSGDTITDISSATTINLYLNGSREVANLGKTSANNIRLVAGTASDGGDASLTITESMNIKQGSYLVRSSSFGGGLTVSVHNLSIGDATGNGRLVIGETGVPEYSDIAFTVSETTALTGSASTISVYADSNLNHVLFKDATSNSGAFGITIGTDVELEVKSVRSEGTIGTTVAIRGQGALMITGDLDDPLQATGANDTKTQFSGSITVKKTGNNTQIFSRERGSNYTGGTEVSEGILAISNTRTNESALGTGSVVVDDGGTLAASGFGTITTGDGEATTVKSGGSLAPGALNSGFATLAFNGTNNGTGPVLTMESGAEFTFRLGAGNLSDLIAMVGYSGPGDLVLNDTAVNITGTIEEGVYTLFTFKSNASTNNNLANLTSVASGLTEGLVLGSGFEGFTGTFYYDNPIYGGIGTISLQLTAVPEPGATTLMVLTLAGVAAALRFRKRGSEDHA